MSLQYGKPGSAPFQVGLSSCLILCFAAGFCLLGASVTVTRRGLHVASPGRLALPIFNRHGRGTRRAFNFIVFSPAWKAAATRAYVLDLGLGKRWELGQNRFLPPRLGSVLIGNMLVDFPIPQMAMLPERSYFGKTEDLLERASLRGFDALRFSSKTLET